MGRKYLAKENLLCEEPPVSVEPLYAILNDCATSLKKYCVLLAAINTGLFDYLSAPRTISDVCRELGIDFKLARNVCKCLKALGFIVEENGSYKNAEISDLYLRSDSPLAQHDVFKDLQNGFRLWEKLAEILKYGPVTVSEERFFVDHIHALAEEAFCGELQRTVNLIAGLPEFKKAKRLLDLGGGHGLYAIAFSKLNPYLQAYVYDFPEVIENTKAYIKKHEADRVEVISGNFFQDDLGNEYDIIFFAYNPGGKRPELVPKIYASLNKEGLFINKHCFYGRDEQSKNILLDIEWNLTAWTGVKKEDKVYSFEGDLSFEEYMKLLAKYFSIKKVVNAVDFAGYPLSSVGDALDSKIIIAKKEAKC